MVAELPQDGAQSEEGGPQVDQEERDAQKGSKGQVLKAKSQEEAV